jgi:adenine phosphoribosyltransferase
VTGTEAVPGAIDSAALATRVSPLIHDVADFPRPGVGFKDLTPLFADPGAFGAVVDWFAAVARSYAVDVVVGVESRGFLLGAPAALALQLPFVPIRKAGKLPRAVLEESYDLEYGSATLAVHADSFAPGARVLVIDDVLATGGTARATATLVRRAGAEPVALAVLMELSFLSGRGAVDGLPVDALIAV